MGATRSQTRTQEGEQEGGAGGAAVADGRRRQQGAEAGEEGDGEARKESGGEGDAGSFITGGHAVHRVAISSGLRGALPHPARCGTEWGGNKFIPAGSSLKT